MNGKIIIRSTIIGAVLFCCVGTWILYLQRTVIENPTKKIELFVPTGTRIYTDLQEFRERTRELTGEYSGYKSYDRQSQITPILNMIEGAENILYINKKNLQWTWVIDFFPDQEDLLFCTSTHDHPLRNHEKLVWEGEWQKLEVLNGERWIKTVNIERNLTGVKWLCSFLNALTLLVGFLFFRTTIERPSRQRW